MASRCYNYLLLFFYFYICCYATNVSHADRTVEVTLTGLFAYNVSQVSSFSAGQEVANGKVVEIATRLAIEDTISQSSRLRLILEPVSTECDPARAVWSLSRAISRRTEPVIILGPPCEESANKFVDLASRYTNIVTVSYGSTTPQLNNATKYRSFFRSVSPFTDLNEVLIELLRYFEWDRICIIQESEAYYNTAAEELVREYNNLTIIEAVPYFNFQYIMSDTYCRIFVLLTTPKILPEIFCEASNSGLTGEEYQWIIVGNLKNDDLMIDDINLNCTHMDLMRALESTLIVSFDRSLSINFENRLQSILEQDYPTIATNVTKYDMFTAASAYDATQTIALALEAAIESLMEQGETLQRYLPLINGHISKTIISSFESLQFKGQLSNIQFTPSRHSTVIARRVSQIQSGTIIDIGFYDNYDLNMTKYGNQLQWIGSGPPRDRPATRIENVPEWARIVMLVISGFGCSLLLSFMFVNCYFRENRIIKASSPHVNTLILIGCIVGFVSVIVYTLAADDRISNFTRSFSCNSTIWCLNIMFTLSFGALLAKTWRVQAVFRNPWTKRRIYKDFMLFVIVFVMLGVDLVVLSIWMIVSHIEIHTEVSLTSSAIIELSHCTMSGYGIYFGMVLVAYKCTLLVFGCFLATQTRNIKAKFFNDTKYIVVAIYCVSLLVIVGFPIGIFMLLGRYIFISYIIITLTITGMSLVISLVVFVPKFILLYKSRHSQSINMLSTSVKMETSKSLGEKKPSLASLVLSEYRNSRAALQLDSTETTHLQNIYSNSLRRFSVKKSRSSLPTITENNINLMSTEQNNGNPTHYNTTPCTQSTAAHVSSTSIQVHGTTPFISAQKESDPTDYKCTQSTAAHVSSTSIQVHGTTPFIAAGNHTSDSSSITHTGNGNTVTLISPLPLGMAHINKMYKGLHEDYV